MWNSLMVIGSLVGLLFLGGVVIVVGRHLWDVSRSGVPDDVKRKAHGLK